MKLSHLIVFLTFFCTVTAYSQSVKTYKYISNGVYDREKKGIEWYKLHLQKSPLTLNFSKGNENMTIVYTNTEIPSAVFSRVKEKELIKPFKTSFLNFKLLGVYKKKGWSGFLFPIYTGPAGELLIQNRNNSDLLEGMVYYTNKEEHMLSKFTDRSLF